MAIRMNFTNGALALAVALSGVALMTSPTTAAESKPAFDEVDTNGNGKISLKEAKAAGVPEPEFKEDDLDNDQRLNKRDWGYLDMNVDRNSS